tara:strand:- start:28651 stop:29139 length:489 start_codon:yes stop_codon:yes gene_type:complete
MDNKIVGDSLPLRAACYEAVYAFPGGVSAMAATLRDKEQVLRNRLNEAGKKTNHHLRLDQFERIADVTQDAGIAHSVASLCGGVFIQLDSLPEFAGDAAILDEVLALVDNVGKLGHEVRDAIADSDVDDGEWRKINRCRAELVSTTYRLMTLVSQLRGDDHA